MTDYIKREDAVDVIARCAKTEDVVEGYPVGKWDEYVEYAKERLSEVPSADVAPVRHGRWEVIDAEEPRRYGCSECKRLSWNMGNYCGNCGARMDGGDEDEKRQV